MLDLNKTIYKPLDDGTYNILVKDWNLQSGVQKDSEEPYEYVELQCTIPELEDRPLKINLFEQSLNITASNVMVHDGLDDINLIDLLEHMKSRTYPAILERRTKNGRTYPNWYIARRDYQMSAEDADEEELPL